MKRLRNNTGYSLVEILVVMAIFVIIIMVTSSSFNSIITNAGQQAKSAETQIQGIVGLEILRSDLEQAGFGLPWAFQNTPSSTLYTEAQVSAANSSTTPGPGVWPASSPPAPAVSWVNSFNDAPDPPRAVWSADSAFNLDGAGVGSKYLVIKSAAVGTNGLTTGNASPTPTGKKWTTKFYANGATTPERIWGDPTRDLAATEQVIVVRNSLVSTPPSRQLMVNPTSGAFSTPFNNYTTLTVPHQDGDTFVVYGIDPASTPRMPFNRADYFVMRPSNMPQQCAPNTGILYKATVQHSDGQLSAPMELLDCVADMQVVYGLDTAQAGFVNDHEVSPITSAALAPAVDIRQHLREIRVYILAHEGKKDLYYAHPLAKRYMKVGEDFGGGIMGRNFDLQTRIGSDWQHYRWKVYTIVVRPKNLGQ